MDLLHCALSQALDELSIIEDFRFADAFGNFVAKLEQSFRLEEASLEKMQYPLVSMQLEEHARTLSALHHVHSRVMSGKIQEGREVVRNVLPQWFAFHMATVDFAIKRSLEQAGGYGEPDSRLTEKSGSNVSD